MSKELTLDEKRAFVGELLRKRLELQKLQARPATATRIPRVSRSEPLSLSFSQERFFFLQQLEPTSSMYNISAALRFTGPLDAGALERAFEQIIRRHEVLRTGFTAVDGQPIQVIGTPTFNLPIVDLAGLAPQEKEAALDRHRRERATKPFDLQEAPLLRGTLVRLGEAEHVLLLTVHHIVFDALSFGPLLGELCEIYNASKEQRAPRLTDLTTQFADYAAWQRGALVGEPLEKLLTYWKKQLDGVPPLEMPTDRAHRAAGGTECKRECIVLPKELLEELKLLGRRAGVTPFTIMLTAFEVLLHRYSGQERFAIGVPILHRALPEVEASIGCFAHPLALAADLSGDPTFLHLLKRVHDATLEAYAHQDLPFEKLVAETSPERQIHRNPIFQVLFGHHAGAAAPTFLGLETTFLSETGGETTMGMDLFFNLFEQAHGLLCSLDYSADVFDASTVVRLLRSYEALLKAVVVDPEERVAALPILGRDDEERLLAWNKAARPAPRDACVHELIEHHADRTPDAPAVTFGREHLTYRELDRRANQLAHHLRSLGVKPDVVVGVCMTRSLEMVAAVVGILKAGGAYLPLDPEEPGERLASIVAEARPAVILTQQAIRGALPDSGTLSVCIDPSWELVAKEGTDRPDRSASGEHAAHVLYVSGPEGRPVGVVNTHRGLVQQLDGMRESYPFRETDSVLQHTPPSSHVSFLETLWPLCSGARLVLAPPNEARSLHSAASGRPVGIAIAATFTAEPLEEPIAFWSRELEQPFHIQFAGHGQVFQELLDPSGLFSRNQDGVNVVLVRFDDWIEAGIEEGLERNVTDFVRALRAATERSSTPQLVVLCPASPGAHANPSWTAAFDRMERVLQSALAAMHSVHLVVPSEVERRYPVAECHDAASDELGRVPYTPAYFAALGTTIARKVHALRRQPYKVIVLDCDETLWKGICGEVGPLGVEIDPARRALQEFVIAQHEAGMLVALCSKNNEADVVEVFERNPHVILKRDHVVSWRINWSPKSQNLRSLAEELNLGLDSFIFIDDSALECAEVRASCPDVLVLQVPKDDAAIPRFLDHVWAFDRLRVTAEDRKRNEQYRQNALREHARRDALTFTDFLAGLDLRIHIAEMTDQLRRVSQLTQRTNQFTVTTIRRTEAEIEHLARSGELECYVVDVSDRFGDYGLVGVVFFHASLRSLDVDTFLLSCRAMGRGVEHRMIARLGEIARERGLTDVVVPYVATQKNEPARQFLETVGRDFRENAGDRVLFRFPTDFAAALAFAPGNGEGPSVDADRPEAPKRAAGARLARSEKATRIATELHDVAEILKSYGPGDDCMSEAASRDALEAKRIAKLLVEERITTAFLSPDVLSAMCRDGEIARSTTLRRVLTSAELMPRELPQRFLEHVGAELLAFYGAAEVGIVTVCSHDRAHPSQPSLGRPTVGRHVFVLDAQKRPVPIGVAGEIYVGGDGIAREYLGAPELTASRFVRAQEGVAAGGRLYRTGDVARYRSDGSLEVRGRRDDRVAVHGFHVEAAEIEAALAAHPAVEDVAVVARADESGRRRHFACVVPTEGGRAPAASELHRFLAARLPGHALPSAIAILSELPRTASGAIDRHKLPGTAEPTARRRPFVPPRDDLEARMVGIWQELLGARQIGVHDAFFEVGGQSLLAVRLLSRLRREFDRDIPLSAIFEGGTVEHLCDILREGRRSSSSVLVPLRTSGSRLPLFLAHSIIASPISYGALSKELGADQPVYGFQTQYLDSDDVLLETVARMVDIYLVELRRAQPRGPYHLAGHSSGGVLALEMAQKLRAQGEAVELLALIDTLHPDRAVKDADDATIALEVLGLDAPPASWETRTQGERLHWAVTQELDPANSGGIRSSLAGLDPKTRLRIVRIIAAQYRAWRGYAPRSYGGRAIFLRASAPSAPSRLIRNFDAPQAEWVDLLPKLEVRDVAGDHHTMLEAPHVADLARTIGSVLGARSASRDFAPAAKTTALSTNGRST